LILSARRDSLCRLPKLASRPASSLGHGNISHAPALGDLGGVAWVKEFLNALDESGTYGVL